MVGVSIFFPWLLGLRLGLILFPFTCKCKEWRCIWRMTSGMLRSFLQCGCPWRSTAELAAKQGSVEVATCWLLPGIVIIITFIHRRKWSLHIDEVEKLPGKLLCDKIATYIQGKMKTLAPIDKMSRICSAIQHTSKASQLRSFFLICLWFSLASIY